VLTKDQASDIFEIRNMLMTVVDKTLLFEVWFFFFSACRDIPLGETKAYKQKTTKKSRK